MKSFKIEHHGSTHMQVDDNGEIHVLLDGGSLRERVKLTARRSSPTHQVLADTVLRYRLEELRFKPFSVGSYLITRSAAYPSEACVLVDVAGKRFELIISVHATQSSYRVWGQYRGDVHAVELTAWSAASPAIVQELIDQYLPELEGFAATYADFQQIKDVDARTGARNKLKEISPHLSEKELDHLLHLMGFVADDDSPVAVAGRPVFRHP